MHFPWGPPPPLKNHPFVSLQHHNNDEVLDVFGVPANVRGSAYIISSRSASLKHGQRMRLLPMTQIPNSGRTRLKAAGSQAHRSSGSEISGHHLHRGDRQKFSRGPGVPCSNKKGFCSVFFRPLHALPLPTNFSPACTGCQKKVVFAIMDNQNLPNRFFPLHGELFPRPFGRKMYFPPESYIFTTPSKMPPLGIPRIFHGVHPPPQKATHL